MVCSVRMPAMVESMMLDEAFLGSRRELPLQFVPDEELHRQS